MPTESQDTVKNFWKPTGRDHTAQGSESRFDEANLKKLPKVKELDAEYSELLIKKKAAYPDYRKARDEMQELIKAQKNVELFFAKKKTPGKAQTR